MLTKSTVKKSVLVEIGFLCHIYKRMKSCQHLMGLDVTKPCLRGFSTHKDADQPANPLVSVAEKTVLRPVLLETPKTGFVRSRSKCMLTMALAGFV